MRVIKFFTALGTFLFTISKQILLRGYVKKKRKQIEVFHDLLMTPWNDDDDDDDDNDNDDDDDDVATSFPLFLVNTRYLNFN